MATARCRSDPTSFDAAAVNALYRRRLALILRGLLTQRRVKPPSSPGFDATSISSHSPSFVSNRVTLLLRTFLYQFKRVLGAILFNGSLGIGF
ncbi:unnamed protein product [Citrullus colocynthis]|uniref:Uncharacterized protein n=1 Tax=Citrullus colocynthis TaxID=252529 RepID=A0ABP0Y639_9ROSI